MRGITLLFRSPVMKYLLFYNFEVGSSCTLILQNFFFFSFGSRTGLFCKNVCHLKLFVVGKILASVGIQCLFLSWLESTQFMCICKHMFHSWQNLCIYAKNSQGNITVKDWAIPLVGTQMLDIWGYFLHPLILALSCSTNSAFEWTAIDSLKSNLKYQWPEHCVFKCFA